MKKLLILSVICLSLGGCKVYEPKFDLETYYLDYRPFTSDGFFITESNSVSFEYTSVGSILVESTSGYTKEKTKKVENNDIYGDGTYEDSKYIYRDASLYDCLEDAILQAKQLGADGIINLEMKPINKLKKGYYADGYYITGMAIKRVN